MKRISCVLGPALLLALTGRIADAYLIATGTGELRPVIGTLARITGQPSQFLVGLDWAHSVSGPTAFVLGAWTGFAEEFVGLGLHVGVKHRFLGLHPRVAPFVTGGAGFTSGFPAPGGQALLGLGFRFGGGVDFFATRRILPGFQIVFDVGPRFTPTTGGLASAPITFGCSFLL
jgi:hypothetical protein